MSAGSASGSRSVFLADRLVPCRPVRSYILHELVRKRAFIVANLVFDLLRFRPRAKLRPRHVKGDELVDQRFLWSCRSSMVSLRPQRERLPVDPKNHVVARVIAPRFTGGNYTKIDSVGTTLPNVADESPPDICSRVVRPVLHIR